MINLTWLSIICLFFGFQYLADVTYCAITKKNYNPYTFKNILDVWIFFIFLVHIFITFTKNLANTISEGPTVVTWDKKAVVYCRNYVDNSVEEHTLLILGVVLLWLRVINFFRYNEYLGQLIGVIKKLVEEIFLFFVLYLVNLIIFSVLAESCFIDLPDYN